MPSSRRKSVSFNGRSTYERAPPAQLSKPDYIFGVEHLSPSFALHCNSVSRAFRLGQRSELWRGLDIGSPRADLPGPSAPYMQ
eukprot:2760808-Amphidinium_carterae.1